VAVLWGDWEELEPPKLSLSHPLAYGLDDTKCQ